MSQLRLRIFEAGSCLHPEHVVLRTGRFRPLRFPAMFAVIEHPTEGVVLFDTGYSEAFVRATRRFPERLYAWITPVTLDPRQTARAILAREGIEPGDVRAVLVSHFHGDHIGGLPDFPAARLWCARSGVAHARRGSRLSRLSAGVLDALVPNDLEDRVRFLDEEESVPLPASCAPFRRGFDLFGDGSAIAVALPGHAPGHLGLYLRHDDRETLLVSDACWTMKSVEHQVAPHPITRLLFSDTRAYRKTLSRLGVIHERQSLRIIPSHCEMTLRTACEGAT